MSSEIIHDSGEIRHLDTDVDDVEIDSPKPDDGAAAPLKNCFRLVLLGSSKVGKTSIVSRFIDNRYEDRYTPTIENFHRKVYRIRDESYRLDILDTSGNNPFPAMRRLSLMTGKYCKLGLDGLMIKLPPINQLIVSSNSTRTSCMAIHLIAASQVINLATSGLNSMPCL